jgi:RNA polymerase sigma-32 factor
MAARKPASSKASSAKETPAAAATPSAGKAPASVKSAGRRRKSSAASQVDNKPDETDEARETADAGEALEAEPEVLESELIDAEFGDADTPDIDEIEISADDGALPVPAGKDQPAIAPTDSLARYLSEIRTYPVLSREEEHEIALRYFHHHDADAAVKLVTANLRLVVIVAREYQRAFHNLLDLIQEGNVGLLEAVKQFDPYRGVRFPSYAVWWIRAYVIRYVMNNFRLVKVGTTQAQRRLFFNLKKEKARLESLGFTPSAKQIADVLGVKEKEVIEMDQRLASSSEVSVETPLGHDGGTGTMLDLLPAPGHSAEQDVSDGEFYALMKEKIEEFGSRLKGREAEIYRERLVAEDPLTLQELGDRYGVSRERVRQMEAAVKKKLREYLVAEVRDLDEEMVR